MVRKVYYVPDVAEILGMTESAIRCHIQRRSTSIPSWIRIGKRICWRRQDIEEWLATKQASPTHPQRKRGRPSNAQLAAEGRL